MNIAERMQARLRDLGMREAQLSEALSETDAKWQELTKRLEEVRQEWRDIDKALHIVRQLEAKGQEGNPS